MPRPKRLPEGNEIDKIMSSSTVDANDINEMPLTSLAEYIAYNKEARRLNKKLKLNRYPIKPCPVELHPKEKIIFARKDQPTNPLPVYLSNDLIDFKITLEPGKTYELPRCVVEYLASKGTPHWQWVTNADGSTETKETSIDPRFSLRTIYSS
jgi:hypothetical protein